MPKENKIFRQLKSGFTKQLIGHSMYQKTITLKNSVLSS